MSPVPEELLQGQLQKRQRLIEWSLGGLLLLAILSSITVLIGFVTLDHQIDRAELRARAAEVRVEEVALACEAVGFP